MMFNSMNNRVILKFLSFLHCSFVSCLNAEDEVPIQLGFSDADPLKSERLKVLESMGIALTDRLAVRKTPKFFTSKLLVFCRVFNMDESESI